MIGKAKRPIAPSARIAAMANDASSSSASMAPLAAMIAETPQIEEPIASRLMSFGFSLKARPSQVISAIEIASSSATATRLTAPSFSTSPRRNRTPRSTMPSLSQNSYVATPARKIFGTPTVLAMTSPMMMAQSTYSMFGSARWCALPKPEIVCSRSLPA
jgi:hypothetical protein